MAEPYDRILVVDLEATCWEGGRSLDGEPSEIIQVGSCCLLLGSSFRPNDARVLGYALCWNRAHTNEP